MLNIIAMIVFYFSGAPVHSVLLRRNTLQAGAVEEHKRAVINLLEYGLFRKPKRLR
jgi:hypothetical protein